MGSRGPKPTPTNVRLAKGETRPSRLNHAEPEPRDRLPRPPADMNADAKVVWTRVMREMASSRAITAADTDVLRCYCDAVVRYAQVQKLYETTQPLVRNKAHGDLVRTPLHQMVRDNADQIRAFARELGLTPSARAGMQMLAEEITSSIDDAIGPPPRPRLVASGA